MDDGNEAGGVGGRDFGGVGEAGGGAEGGAVSGRCDVGGMGFQEVIWCIGDFLATRYGYPRKTYSTCMEL